MVHRLLNPMTLSRAKKIPDSAVINWGIIQDSPPLVYAVIKGSRNSPYPVIIDMTSQRLAHDCPVFMDFVKSSKATSSKRRRRKYKSSVSSPWCKHFGKLLLMVDKEMVDKIIKSHSFSELKYITRGLKKRIKELKLKDLSQSKVTQNSIFDNLKLLEHNIKTKHEDIDFELELLDQILVKFEGLDNFSKLQLMFEWLNHIKKSIRKEVDTRLDQIFTKVIYSAYDEFFDNFWTSSVYRRLEKAYLLRQCGKFVNFDYYTLDIPLNPDGIPRVEREDGAIVINALISDLKLKYKTMKQIGISYSKQEILNRYKMLTNELRMKGSGNDKFKKWLNKRLNYNLIETRNYVDTKEFLLYLLTIVNYKPKADVLKNTTRSIYVLDKKELNDFPVLQFCIERIKRSQRDYITSSELREFNRFFDYLRGKQIKSNYIEKKRNYVEDYDLPSNGILIQWDISTTSSSLQAIYGDKTIIIDNRSIISSSIQPFDITICKTPLKIDDEFTYIVYPEVIISPIQAVKLIAQGFEIISNVLPWEILYKYHNNKTLTAVEINKAITNVKDFYFIYGAFELLDHLEKISIVSSTQISKEEFEELSDTIRLKSTFDEETVKSALSIIEAEGGELQMILDLMDLSDKDKGRLILNAINRASTKTELREQLSKDIVHKIIKSNKPSLLFNKLKDLEFERYPIFDDLSNKIHSELVRLTKRFAKRPPTKRILRKNLIGLSILNTLEIQGDGKLSNTEKEAISLKLEQVVAQLDR